ncbi:MAG: hypothetical protein U0Q16_02565 [Bryobacteraceae bacterium]
MPAQIQALLQQAPDSLSGAANVVTVTALQRKLDEIDLQEAKTHREAIQYLCDEIPELAYTHVESCTATLIIAELKALGLAGGWIKYNSAKFEGKAKVYVIAGKNSSVELGFGQYCTSKNHIAHYENTMAYRQCIKGNPSPGVSGFPIGDSSDDATFPFYFKGISAKTGCTSPTWEKLQGKSAGSRDYEFNDQFSNNGLPAFLQLPRAPSASSMASLARRQGFTMWLIRRTSNGGHERLLRECKYEIGLDIKVSWPFPTSPVCVTTDASTVGAVTTPSFDAQRVAVSIKTLNNAEGLAVLVPGGNWQEL